MEIGDKERQLKSTLIPESKQEVQKDNRIKALIAINICCIGGTGQAVLFKVISREGVHLLDYQLFRNIALLIFSIATLLPAQINLIDVFPCNKKVTLAIRILAGQVTFAMFNIGVQMIPISLFVIIFNTNTFWISLLGLLVNREPIVRVELIGMVICFSRVAMLGLTSGNTETDEADSHSNCPFGILIGLLAALIFSISSITTRRLKEVPTSAVTFYHSLTGFTVMTIYLLIEWSMKGELRFASYTKR